ncbi:MAG: DmsE family decaheme c-type cytochrome [Candidatus Acidiferrales bacterium]
MGLSTKSRVLLIPLAVTLAAFGLLPQLARGQAKETPPAKPEVAAPPNASDYVGSEVCKTCHEDLYNGWEKSPHWKTTFDTQGGPSKHGCEACHGPGSAHVEGGGDKTKIFAFKGVSAKEISSRCLACHTYSEEHSNYSRSVHLENNVSCIDCHSPHHPKDDQNLMRQKQPQLCYGCHLETKQQFTRPFHHRVNEGLVNCTDCHNPHGSNLGRQLRATSSQDLVCFKCHADKAGPFVHEHQAVKVEGCVACHTPHGSSNPRLLKRSQVNLLCLECHSLTVDASIPTLPSFHNQAQKYQACTLCHTQIHGSNFDPFFFK